MIPYESQDSRPCHTCDCLMSHILVRRHPCLKTHSMHLSLHVYGITVQPNVATLHKSPRDLVTTLPKWPIQRHCNCDYSVYIYISYSFASETRRTRMRGMPHSGVMV